MMQEEIERWEEYAREAAQRDFERKIYEQCEHEGSERGQP